MPNNNMPAKYQFKKTLYEGMQGREVEVLQMWLDDLNSYYNFYEGKPLKATGYFGKETKRFLTWFQLFVGLYPADGMYDYRTHDMLQARYNNYLDSFYESAQARGVWNK